MSAPSSHTEAEPAELDIFESLPPPKDEPMRPYFVIRQDVELEINFREKRIVGKCEITIASVRGHSMEEIAIDARQTEIDVGNIEIELLKDTQPVGAPRKIAATYEDPYKLLDYPIGSTPVDGSIRINLKDLERTKDLKEEGNQKRPIKIRVSSANPGSSTTESPFDPNPLVSQEYRVTIPFTTKNIRDGIQFVGVDPGDFKWPHVYTRHSIEPGTASCIFPCIDDHGQSCAWSLAIKLPKTLGDALRQPLATQNGVNGHSRSAGQKSQPHNDDYALSEEDKLLEMTAICSGFIAEELIDPTDDSKKIMLFELDKKASAQKLGFAVGPFQLVDVSAAFRPEADDEKLGANALKIQAFCLPGRAEETLNTCQALPSAADFFTLTFARYPFEEYRLCFVDDMVNDTIAVHSLSLVSTRLLYPENVVDPDAEVDISRKLVQSLAVQWSGINLLPSRRNDLWVVIGIAYYMADLYLKKLCGNNDYRFRMKSMVDELVEVDTGRASLYDLGRSLHVGDFEMDFMTLKAPLIMFILDKRLAKAPAQTNLTRIISRILYKANIGERQGDWLINTESFRRFCEKNSKSKLESFWKQWIYGTGCPRFDVQQKFNKKKLCVEMMVRQVQVKERDSNRALDKNDFLRLVKEKLYDVAIGEIQPWFTGPMTIRIHEADGTPYEHIVEVREDAAAMKMCKFDIPYNTKYKRLKRSRRQRDRAAAQTTADGEVNEDSLLYCLGDVLQSQDDIQEWDLLDWPADMEKKMDQESYEWIRMDADFEWICTMKTNSESYMYVSQLQQDRDVVAQQDTMLYLGRSPPHPLVSSILTRTLFDKRYFHGIRTMAASQLHRHSVPGPKDSMVGLFHLLRAFTQLCCFPGTQMPRPNDFSDRKQYLAQSAIPLAIARVRDSNGKCPERARHFLLEQVQFNNNANNPFSDNFYVAKLLEALATSMIPDKRPDTEVMLDDIIRTDEEDQFLQNALTEIDRYRRMDDIGLAGLAFGEFSKPNSAIKPQTGDMFLDGFADEPKEDMLVVEAGDKETTERRQEYLRKHDLHTALTALKAEMKDQFAHHEITIQKTLWYAINQDTLGRAEKATLLEFCGLMFDASDEWIVSLPLPQRWKVSRPAHRVPGKLIVTFTPYYRDSLPRPKELPKAPEPAPVPLVEPLPKPVEPKRVIVNPKVKANKVPPPAAPGSEPRQPLPTKAAAPLRDSPVATPIRVSPALKESSPRPLSVPERQGSAQPRTELPSSAKVPKRPRPDKMNGGDDQSPIAKRPKIGKEGHSGTARPRKIVTIRHPALRRILKELNVRSSSGVPRKPSSLQSVRASPAADGTIQAKPARKPLPSGGDSVRKPLPSGLPTGTPSSKPTASSIAHSSSTSVSTPTPAHASPPPPSSSGSQPAAAPKRLKLVIKKPTPKPPPAP
ncbi:hypothetical protein BN1708_007108 [Verticillium longisporum]|uniref:Transcription initiation factor TFIID subunit 2 n=1 Tax=Verticillium longisporum TaxID=100787 RepID=A0A0G4MR73_VERLO|nr:hypothetical protein BN1708_007108 [Verticillium longisporum]